MRTPSAILVQGFLEWITGEKSPTLSVSFWTKKREIGALSFRAERSGVEKSRDATVA